MSLNLNAALSSFITASPRLIHHSKKKKKTSSTDLSRDQNTICVWTQYSNSCSSSAGRLVYGSTNTWMGHICFYLFIYFYFALRHRPLSLPQSPPHQCCAGAGSAATYRWKWNSVISATQSQLLNKQVYFMPSLCVRVNPGNLLARRTSESINL